jgi:hypothetical protein
VCREIRIGERSGRFTDFVPIEIQAGETTRVTTGGKGRPVIGKVVVPEEVKDRLDWQSLDYYIRNQSAEGSSQSWAFKLASDGTFRAENIPAGDHCFYLTAYATPADSRAFRGERIGTLTHPFTIPEMPEGRSDEPLDLGVLEWLAVGGSANASSLVGRAVPDLQGLNLGIAPEESAGKRLLICFFDMGQRPSRNTVLQLARQAGQRKEKEMVVVLVQASKVEEPAFKEWVRQNAMSLPAGRIQGDENRVRFTWGVRSLPWLILTDKNHTVTAEGFAVGEVDAKASGPGN